MEQTRGRASGRRSLARAERSILSLLVQDSLNSAAAARTPIRSRIAKAISSTSIMGRLTSTWLSISPASRQTQAVQTCLTRAGQAHPRSPTHATPTLTRLRALRRQFPEPRLPRSLQVPVHASLSSTVAIMARFRSTTQCITTIALPTRRESARAEQALPLATLMQYQHTYFVLSVASDGTMTLARNPGGTCIVQYSGATDTQPYLTGDASWSTTYLQCSGTCPAAAGAGVNLTGSINSAEGWYIIAPDTYGSASTSAASVPVKTPTRRRPPRI